MLTRFVLRNLLIAIALGLPTTLVAGAVAASLLREEPPLPRSVLWEQFTSGMTFWWVLLAVPTLVLGLLHQVVLAALPHHWSSARTRLAIVGSSVGGALLSALPFALRPTARGALLLLVVVPGALLYGALARPLRPSPRHAASDAG